MVIFCLTSDNARIIIETSSEHRGGIATPEVTGQKAAMINAVFLCPSKIKAELVRLKSFMVGCIGHLSRWPVPVAGCCNLVQSASQRLQPMRGGYIHTTGATVMNKSVQNPPKPQENTNQSVINDPERLSDINIAIIRANESLKLVSAHIKDYAQLKTGYIQMLKVDALQMIETCNAALSKSAQNPLETDPETDPEMELCYICLEIGGISESNCHYTAGLTRRIAETGKPIEQLTVAELLKLHRQHKDWFNEIHRG